MNGPYYAVIVCHLSLFLLVFSSSAVYGFTSTISTRRIFYAKYLESATISQDEGHIMKSGTSDEPDAQRIAPMDTLPSVDPLLMNILQTRSCSSSMPSSSYSLFGNSFHLSQISKGIKIWRHCLNKGRYPIASDFDQEEGASSVWPAEPFFAKVIDAMATLELPRFVMKHPETISAVLLTLLRLTFQLMDDLMAREEELLEDAEYDREDDLFEMNCGATSKIEEAENPSPSAEEIDRMAAEIADAFVEEWSGVVSGVNILDQLFGYDHDLFNAQEADEEDDDDDSDAMVGFGLEDGIWKHTGWHEIPILQKQLGSMQELKDLMRDIGRRPTAENSDEVHKFAPRKQNADGAMGAQFDSLMQESVSGITLSGSLTEMLPSEAVLLRGSSGALRRLFMAKKAESKLLSYEMSGWEDMPSVSLTKPLYMQRMPSAPGGPIILCLDTSWSMSGMREQLSKAVVLACVSMAHKQRRDCQVVAFSTERGIMEAGVITSDGAGLKRLLDFLSHSFGGGTDVTGALKFAIETLDSDIMSAADILMISDGEIPDPPVSIEIMEALDRLKLRKGVEVYGLLVGKKESKPLSRLCTNVYDFLMEYDTQAIFGSSTALRMSSAYQISQPIRNRSGAFGFTRLNKERKSSITLYAKYSKYNDDNYGKIKKRKKGRKKKWSDDEYDGECVPQNAWCSDESKNFHEDDCALEETDNNGAGVNSFLSNVGDITQKIKASAKDSIAAEVWKPYLLKEEREADGSCWKYREELEAAVDMISMGLVERQEESRLVVLAMLSMEHIILLGVPGTGKSVLGRRLSKLCNGAFFQRLLTKFSTPEELFGPLSLKSLENDEYRRCTQGFLPTASIAFLDEVFKANSAILNTLLTVLNERKFDNAGGQEDCPIRCVVGASNELPESDELVALFDRFLIRKEVLPVSDEGILTLLSMSNPGCDDQKDESCDVIFINDLDQIIASLSDAADSVQMGSNACELMRDLRTFMREEHNVEISDRRLVKAGRLLKISASSHGRNRVDPIDCLLLQHCMWEVPEQRMIVRDWLWENITPGGQMDQFRLLLDTLRGESLDIARKTSGDVTGKSGARKSEVDVIHSLRDEIAGIFSILKNHHFDLSRHIELIDNASDFLWLDPNESKSAKQLLRPRAEKALNEVARALIDCRSLEICLEESDQAPPNEQRHTVIQNLWEEGYAPEVSFTVEELSIGMKEAKKKYDLETFRKWKRAKKRSDK